MKTVVVLHPHFTVAGGAGKFVLEVGSRLADRGYRVLVLCIRADPRIVGPFTEKMEFRETGGALSSSFRFWLLFPWVLIKIWRSFPEEPFVLFPQVFPANWWGFLSKLRRDRIPLVWMCQEPSAFIHSRQWLRALPEGLPKRCAYLFNPLLKRIDVRLARLADRVIANSYFTRRSACEIYGYRPEDVRICHPGVDTLTFRRDQAVARRNQVITIGRLTRFKNVDVIVRALRILNQGRREPIVLRVVGRGEEEVRLQGLVKSLNMEGVVVFSGFLEEAEVVRGIQESKAFILASVDEPFGIVTVEAMACGTPCVVHGTGGPAETVLDGRTGFHVGSQDPAAYAERVRALFDDESLFRSLSDQAVERARSYSWERAADELATCFDGLDGPGGRTGPR